VSFHSILFFVQKTDIILIINISKYRDQKRPIEERRERERETERERDRERERESII
jgi:hypothetical protein